MSASDNQSVLRSFYQWSEQMFLWLTSPAPPIYGSGGRIFDSATFFDVSPPDTSGNRTFIPHSAGFLRNFSVRAAQVGPGGLPIIFDKSGRMLEVVHPHITANATLQVRTRTGSLVEIDRARINAGKVIELGLLTNTVKNLRPQPGNALRVQKFLISGIPIFLDGSGNVVEVEQGQADGGVLQAQNGSLIYYATMVNDVYAYFLTGPTDHQINPATQFPTTQADLNAITTFAAGHGKTFIDPAALAVEVKTSWIEAAGLPNLASYITMTATVPTYDKSNPALWTPNGHKTVLLALLGIHVVGSANGHPEMIWATFEHLGNTPDAAYSYINTGGHLVSVPETTVGTWLFAANGSVGPFNVVHMNEPFGTLNIAAVSPHTISTSDTIRWKTWGAASDISPNPISGSPAASNSEIISINNSVHGMLAAGDVRGNYIMRGATWTIGGAPPNNFNQVGTSQLANTTMETYQQSSNTTAGANHFNCFACHTSNGTDVSHIYGGVQPLF